MNHYCNAVYKITKKQRSNRKNKILRIRRNYRWLSVTENSETRTNLFFITSSSRIEQVKLKETRKTRNNECISNSENDIRDLNTKNHITDHIVAIFRSSSVSKRHCTLVSHRKRKSKNSERKQKKRLLARTEEEFAGANRASSERKKNISSRIPIPTIEIKQRRSIEETAAWQSALRSQRRNARPGAQILSLIKTSREETLEGLVRVTWARPLKKLLEYGPR
jgi:hypothetical protein